MHCVGADEKFIHTKKNPDRRLDSSRNKEEEYENF